jgi:hypothetical protein
MALLIRRVCGPNEVEVPCLLNFRAVVADCSLLDRSEDPKYITVVPRSLSYDSLSACHAIEHFLVGVDEMPCGGREPYLPGRQHCTTFHPRRPRSS